MKSLDRDFLERQSIPIEFAGTLRLIGEYRGKQELFKRQMPQVLNMLRQTAIIQSTESSNRIEGITVDEKRLRPLLEKGATPQNRSEAELIGYRNALAWIHTMHDRIEITPDTILRIHRDMLSKTDIPSLGSDGATPLKNVCRTGDGSRATCLYQPRNPPFT